MNQILESTKFVVENSKQVSINQDRFSEFAHVFDHGKTKHWLAAAPFDFSTLTDEQKLNYIFVLNSISFSYWGEPNWSIDYQGKNYNGAYGMIIAIRRALEEQVPILDFSYLASISKDQFEYFLRGNGRIPLLEERLKILHEISSVVIKKYNGSVKNILRSVGPDAQKFLDTIVNNFQSFSSDTSLYQGKKIYFFKRAQLLTLDIHQIFNGKFLTKGIGEITACADYKLPMILRKYGILEYTKELAQKIDGRIELDPNSEEEVEIRANTIWAVEYIKAEVRKRIPDIQSFEINDHLWLATQEKFPDDKPYHRTRTTSY